MQSILCKAIQEKQQETVEKTAVNSPPLLAFSTLQHLVTALVLRILLVRHLIPKRFFNL